MRVERINDQEFENILRVTSTRDLPSSAKALITELYLRMGEARTPTSGDRLRALESIVSGMEEELELLGQKPDAKVLRDRLKAVVTAVRDLAQVISDESRQSTEK